MTEEVKRIKFARICIEVSAEHSFPNKVELELENGSIASIDIEYGWVPKCCCKCKTFGHLDRNYSKAISSEWRPCENSSTSNPHSNDSNEGWTLVTNKNKSKVAEVRDASPPSPSKVCEATTSNSSDQIQAIKPKHSNDEGVKKTSSPEIPSTFENGESTIGPSTTNLTLHNSFQCLDENFSLAIEDKEVTLGTKDFSNSVSRPILQTMEFNSAPSANPLRDKLLAVDELDTKKHQGAKKPSLMHKNGAAFVLLEMRTYISLIAIVVFLPCLQSIWIEGGQVKGEGQL